MKRTFRNLVSSDAKYRSGIRVKYQNNVLCSIAKPTAEANFELAKKALSVLLDIDPQILFVIRDDDESMFESNGGTVEFYHTC